MSQPAVRFGRCPNCGTHVRLWGTLATSKPAPAPTARPVPHELEQLIAAVAGYARKCGATAVDLVARLETEFDRLRSRPTARGWRARNRTH